MIVDGRAFAREVLARTKARAEKLSHPPHVVAYAITPTRATRSYLTIKAKSAAEAGCDFEVREVLPLSFDADAIIVQLPLPGGADTKAILDAIPLEKDADVLSAAAREAFERGSSTPGVNANPETPGVLSPLLPPVVGAIAEIFKRYAVEAKGKRVVVVGAGFLVGAPAATWLVGQGAEVTVVDIDTPEPERDSVLRAADIIVSGAGAPHVIKPEMLKGGVVLIDAGTSELGGRVVGDADPACAEKCALFTPVPGGIGPLAVAKLFENAVELATRRI
jgi:methylenetetrahydrofolate dehydrogenase (NADP+)/methenyltetrahydrofolate cyclohydrolase